MYKPFDELTLADNWMFGKVFSKEEHCRKLLEILLGITIKKLEYPENEKTIAGGYEGRGIRLDVHTADDLHDYDIEVQVAHTDDLAKRSRYYQGMMDFDYLEKGRHFSELKENIIIFICMFDPFGEGLPVYTFRNTCQERQDIFLGDKTVKVWYNVWAREKLADGEPRAFLDYVATKSANSDFTRKLSSYVEEVKMTARERKEYMDLQMLKKKERDEGMQQGLRQGAHDNAVMTARNFLALGIVTQEQIAQATGLTLAEVRQLAGSR